MDDLLAEHGLARTMALTVRAFCGRSRDRRQRPRRHLAAPLVRVHGERFGVAAIEPPLPFGATRVRVVATRAAMTDAGVAWLMELIQREAPASRRAPRRGVRASRR